MALVRLRVWANVKQVMACSWRSTRSSGDYLGSLSTRLPSGETRTLVYRGQRMVPHRRRSFGWFATVSHWDVEDHEIQIDFERDLVRDIQARIRRSQLGARA